MDYPPAVILVVDDIEDNRIMLERRLTRLNYQVITVATGQGALALLQTTPIDLILLDIGLPDISGDIVLAQIKAHPLWQHLPVIIISAITALETIISCIAAGADDYLTKPFNPTLLQVRVRACLDKKQIRDQERQYLAQIQIAQAKSDRLLHNILPSPIVARLQETPTTIADYFPEATVLFADLVDFTHLATHFPVIEVVATLNTIFSWIDDLVAERGLEKIKTIGDAYMVAGGVPVPRADHAEAIADLALALQAGSATMLLPGGRPLQLRIGIHSGPVIAGVIGRHKFSYDLWGEDGQPRQPYGVSRPAGSDPGERHDPDPLSRSISVSSPWVAAYEGLRGATHLSAARPIDYGGSPQASGRAVR